MGEWFEHAMTPHQIYEFLTTGPGSDRLDNAQAAARSMWAEEGERAELIRKQRELIQSGWQGAASDRAFGAAHPLATSAQDRVDGLSSAEDLLDRQSGSFHRAKNSVMPVPPDPPQLDMTDPNIVFTDFEKEVVAYQAGTRHNFDVFRDYDGASRYNETNIPAQYSIINQSGGTISVTADDAGNGGDSGDGPDTGQPRGGADAAPPEWVPPGGGPGSGPQVPQQTSPSDFAPPPVSTPGFQPSAQSVPTGPAPAGLVAGLPISGGTGGPGGRGGGYGGTGGPGRAGPGAGMRGGPLGGGLGAGARMAEEAAAQRAAAAAGSRGAGAGMMGGAPAGRGKGDEDDEHKRKVLLEADSEGVFGSDTLTAPQVIGDDEYEDD